MTCPGGGDPRRFRTCLFLTSRDDMMRVVGPAPMGGDFLEIVLDEAPLRKAMLNYSVDILLLSLLISAITATLVFLALHYLFVRPMRRITANMMAFRADPENASLHHRPSGPRRRDRHGASGARRYADRARLDAASKEPAWPRSGWRCPRSITTCAICWPRRSCFPTSCRPCPIRGCSVSRRS